jgi:hypothetical protein
MSITKETLPVEGVLKGQGRERPCRLRVTRCSTYPDEGAERVSVSYSKCRIEDADDFPDGDYELVFDGHRVFMTKKAGQYALLTGLDQPS